mgnify:CR=1 FL=1
MGHLIFIGILIVVFGGTAMALHRLTEWKVLEVFLWNAALALFLLFQVLLHKLK